MASGDGWAASAFVHRYQRRVFGLALRMLGDAGSAEDVAQEALTRAWRHAAIFDPGRGAVSTWVLTITRNLAIDALRLRGAVPTADDELARLAPATSGAAEVEGVDNQALIERALGTLPAEQRRALVLAALYGFTAAEVAAADSIPLGTAKTRIRSGLIKLQNAFAREEELR